MDSLLTLVVGACFFWSIAGLIKPKALFFAHPTKKKRLHAIFFPVICTLAVAGLAVAADPKETQEGSWGIAGIFCALAAFYAYRLTRESTKKGSAKSRIQALVPTPSSDQSDSGFSQTFSTSPSFGYGDESASRPKGGKAAWFGPGEKVEVKGHILPGMIYVGENLPDHDGYYNDASLINPKLKVVTAEAWEHGEQMGYWSSYSKIPPQCRGAYLKWLATGRSEPEADIGYVFLFFYGLERRLFHDGRKTAIPEAERIDIVNEVRRLLSIYGENRSLKGYASNFLAMEWVLFQSHDTIPDYINLAEGYSSDPFQVQLARQVAAKTPLSSSTAIQWLILHPEFALRTPARRCRKEFKELFARRYTEQFGKGIVVPQNKKRLSVSYHAASPSLRGLRLEFPELSDPFMLTAPLKKVHAVAEACTDELDAYSRYLGRKGSEPTSLAALALLPKDLILGAPAVGKIQEALAAVTAKGTGLIETSSLYELLGEQMPLQIAKKDAENLATLVEKLGFGIIPDIRYYSVRPDTSSSVAIFPRGHGVDFIPSAEFRLVATMIRLGALVSQSDGHVSSEEELLLSNLIRDNRDLTGIEKDSLLAYLHWCLYTQQGTAGLKQKLAGIGQAGKSAISRILVAVAQADGYIDPQEVKQLEKLYTVLGLDKSQVTSDLHAMASADAPVTVAVRDKESEHAIPVVPSIVPPFSLNEELIRIREKETREVRDVLENIFADQSDEPAVAEVSPLAENSASAMASLDQAHQSLFTRLMEQAHWERAALYEVCKDLGLMLDGAMEVLNEWAYGNVNAPLLDDGDPIFVDIELAKEIADA